MKKITHLIFLAILTLTLNLHAQEDSDRLNANQISIGSKDSIYSEVLKEDREIWIHLPNSHIYGDRYPVLFVLDGEFNFETVVGIMKANVMASRIPEMIVVGIPNTNRFRDLTPSHFGDDSNPSGGGDDFMAFIERELIPFVDSTLPTVKHRTLFGHSLSGLFVVNALLNHSHLFDNYLAIDPSLSWGNLKPLKQARRDLKEEALEGKSIYIAVANTLNNEMDYEDGLKDTTSTSLHLRSIVEFSELANSSQQLKSNWKYYKSETHSSLPVAAEHDAFGFLFSWFKFNHWSEFYSPKPKLTGDELVDLIVSHYAKISEIMRFNYYPWEYDINRLGYMYLDRDDPDRAFPFFELNIQNYPTSPNVYDSMGDYYMRISDNSNAIKYFSKSMELGGANGTQNKLNELKSQN